jgi:WD40 repeat protein
VALVGFDRSARFFRTDTGEPLGQPLPHQGTVKAASFSPDGRSALTAGPAGVRRWDVQTGQGTSVELRVAKAVSRLVFSPDGKFVAASSDESGTSLYRADSLRYHASLGQRGALLAFSPDGGLLATAEGTILNLFDVDTGRRYGAGFGISDQQVKALAFSPGGFVIRLAQEERRDPRLLRWKVPAPIEGSPQRIRLWVEVLTGKELAEDGEPRALDEETLRQRQALLTRLGGPPVKGADRGNLVLP